MKLKHLGNGTNDFAYQLIENHLIFLKLNLKDEALAKKIFDNFQQSWVNIVGKGLVVDPQKLYEELLAIGYPLDGILESTNLNNSNSKANMNTSENSKKISALELGLLSSLEKQQELNLNDSISSRASNTESSKAASSININLLKRSLSAYAFSYHALNFSTTSVDIIVNDKITRTSCLYKIKEFLKLDLKRLAFLERGKMG